MFRKIALLGGAAAGLAALGYMAIAFLMIARSEPGTVLTMHASDRLPVMARLMADWRVRSWDGCPEVERGASPLGQTLRAYGLEGFDNERVLETARQLLATGCDIDRRSQIGQTAMHEAILYNEPAVVRFLLANGADPSITIDPPDGASASSLRHYEGMDALRFAQELDTRSSVGHTRREILQLLGQKSG